MSISFDRRSAVFLACAFFVQSVPVKSYAADGYDTFSKDPRFRTWVKMLDLAQLREYTRGDRQYTIFAPVEASFDNIDPELEKAIGPSASSGRGIDVSETRFIVQSHVVLGDLGVASLQGKTSELKSVNGRRVIVDGTKNPFDVTFIGSNGTLAGEPIQVQNGMIYPVLLKSAHYVPE